MDTPPLQDAEKYQAADAGREQMKTKMKAELGIDGEDEVRGGGGGVGESCLPVTSDSHQFLCLVGELPLKGLAVIAGLENDHRVA